MDVLGTLTLVVLPGSLCPLEKGEELLSFVLTWDKNGQIQMFLVEWKIWPNQGMVSSWWKSQAPCVWGLPYHALDLVETSQGLHIPPGKAAKGQRA